MTRSGVAELLEKISRLVPGIAGYQDREKSRATDKAVREKAAAAVAGARDDFSRVMSDLSRAGGSVNLRIIGDMERIMARMERLEDEIRYASYGFAGWFDHSGVVLEDLERVYEYDLVLLDCAPSVSLVSENVFRAADGLLVPVIPTTLSVRTLSQLLDFLESEHIDTGFVWPFFSMVDRRKTLHRDTVDDPRVRGEGFLPVTIPYATEVERMGIHREPVAVTMPWSRAAVAYRELWSEICRRTEETPPTRRG